ncbi:EexN family lipoprotein [Bartonella harrusi]|uniref:EexN family lipoprotein n=1 Tax=Bartonella harrusi TaxID=2961895 RepID=A0ABY5ERH2_9HYPH|nr:EexN family lipoprotein [Bartonella harrusi]UTO27684.1 EexN family lipoprotein [Bartonella harrusi]
MKKIIFLCIAILFVAGCEKTYSVEEFKNNEKLRKEWGPKCLLGGVVKETKNCQNLLQADNEMFSSQEPVNSRPGAEF